MVIIISLSNEINGFFRGSTKLFRFDFLIVSLDKVGFFWGIINSDLEISIKDRKKMVFINKIFANLSFIKFQTILQTML